MTPLTSPREGNKFKLDVIFMLALNLKLGFSLAERVPSRLVIA